MSSRSEIMAEYFEYISEFSGGHLSVGEDIYLEKQYDQMDIFDDLGDLDLKENESILEEFSEHISNFEKLSIKQAKKLFIEFYHENDLDKKKAIRERLINGTLHVVFSFIIRKRLNLFKNAIFDVGDIINLCIESWIKVIESGELLSVSNFSYLYYSFYRELNSVNFIYKKQLIAENMSLFAPALLDLFVGFIEMRNSGLEVTYNDFINYIKRVNKTGIEALRDKFFTIYNWFDSMYNSCFEYYGLGKISKTEIKKICHFLLGFGLDFSNEYNIDIDIVSANYKEIGDEYLINGEETSYDDEILRLVFETDEFRLTSREKLVLEGKYYQNKTYSQMAREFGVSRERIRTNHETALRKVRKKSSKLGICVSSDVL